MKTYHKIQTVFLRDPDNNFKTLLDGQYAKPEFGYLRSNDWVYTEKVDGTNIRIQYGGKVITLQGKTDKAELHKDLIANINELFDSAMLEKFHEVFINPTDNPTEVCLYGEGYGAGIQKGGGNYQEEKSFVLFDILVAGVWMPRNLLEEVAGYLDIPIVPIIGTGSLPHMVNIIRKGFKSQWGDFQAEGIVARPKVELRDSNGDRVITKLKCKDFPNG